MPIIRANFAALYTPIYDQFLMESFGEESQVYPQVFDVIDDKSKDFIVNSISSLGKWQDSDELAGGQYEDPVLGYSKTITPVKKRQKLQVSFEAHDQDEYALVKEEENVRGMGVTARATVEESASSVLYNGFSTACPDGQYLFSASHPKNREETGTTYDNLLANAFSHTSLEASESEISKNLKTMKGLPIPVPESAILLYPPALRGAVARVLNDRALEQPDTTLRNINRFAGKYKAVEWRYLAADMGGSDTAWYIVFPGLKSLKFVWNARPSFTSWIDNDIEAYCFAGRMIYACAASDWRGVFGSTGL
jgi:hypothetical protein